jgi:hypothetical protein
MAHPPHDEPQPTKHHKTESMIGMGLVRKIVIGTVIGASGLGAFLGTVADRFLPHPPSEPTKIERVYDSHQYRLLDDISDLKRELRESLKRSLEQRLSPAETAQQVIVIIQRYVFLNEEQMEDIRHAVKEFFVKATEVVVEEFVDSITVKVYGIMLGKHTPTPSPLPSPSIMLK